MPVEVRIDDDALRDKGSAVALVERVNSVGGVCIHTGTIPSKTIREAILHLTGYRHRDVYEESYRRKRDITMDDLRLMIAANRGNVDATVGNFREFSAMMTKLVEKAGGRLPLALLRADATRVPVRDGGPPAAR